MNQFKCPICGKLMEDCTHSISEMQDKIADMKLEKRIREIVREELRLLQSGKKA